MVAEFDIIKISEEFDKFHEDVNNLGNNFTKKEFENILPKYLKTDGKSTFIKKIKKINKTAIAKFMKYQTFGKDFKNFDYLIKFYKLKIDKNDMIIFNNNLKHTDVKKEALFIWWILNILKSNEFIRSHWHIIQARLQESLDTYISGPKSKKYDICFVLLDIIIEIDEAGHSEKSNISNDTFKDSLARMNGMALLRLDAEAALKCISYEDNICDIPDKDNTLLKFKNHLIHVILGSLVRDEKIRKTRIIYLFENNIINSIQYFEKKILIKTNELINCNINEKEKINKRRIGFNKALENKRTLLRDFNGKLTLQLFEMKERTEETGKIIKFNEICDIFSIDSCIKKNEIYDFIEENGLFNNLECISWKDLSFVIYKFNNIEENIKDIQFEYYREVEESYETIIKDMKLFYELSSCKIDDYNSYTENIKEYLYTKLNKNIVDLTEENTILKKDLEKYKSGYEFFTERKYKLMGERLQHEGKSDFSEVLLKKLACIKYDFLVQDTKDKEFDSDLQNIQNTIKDFITKYKKYYDSWMRTFTPVFNVNKKEILERTGKLIQDTKNDIKKYEIINESNELSKSENELNESSKFENESNNSSKSENESNNSSKSENESNKSESNNSSESELDY